MKLLEKIEVYDALRLSVRIDLDFFFSMSSELRIKKNLYQHSFIRIEETLVVAVDAILFYLLLKQTRYLRKKKKKNAPRNFFRY